MSTTPHRPGDQTDDELLVQEDLPVGWCVPGRFPGKRADDASGEIDALLGYDDQTVTDEEQLAPLDVEQNEAVDGRWRYIEHAKTKTRVYLRLQRQIAVPEEIRITGVVYLPWPPGDPITSQLLRELPTARIEAAINARLFAATRSSTAGSPRAGTPTPPRPWPSSAASRSALLKAGSRELAPADSCHLDAEDAPDNERGRPR